MWHTPFSHIPERNSTFLFLPLQALEKAGVPEGHTTVENYFNFKAEAVPSAVDTIVKGLTQNAS